MAEPGSAMPLMDGELPHPAGSPDILDGFHLVEADAGTGKTWTLATLVVRAIREGRYKLGEILVVTFTHAATAELSERIRKFLQDALATCQEMAEPDSEVLKERERMRLALAQIDALTVQTIHGFCQSVLRENSFALDLSSGFVLDESKGSDLEEVIAQWWREQVPGNGLALSDAAWKAVFAGGFSLRRILTLLKASAGDPDLIILPAATELGLEVSAEVGNFETSLSAWMKLTFHQAVVSLQRVREVMTSDGEGLLEWLLGPAKALAPKSSGFGRKFSAKHAGNYIARIAGCETLAKAFGIIKDIERFSMSSMRQLFDTRPPVFCEVFEACESLAKDLNALRAINALVAQGLAPGLLQRLHEHRSQAGEMGFDGLLQEVFLLVSQRSGAASQLRARFPMAMIDESQDTDPLQWSIFERIYLPPESATQTSLIMVGDPKQAIYGFRGADVYTYLRAGRHARARHNLRTNRRASATVVAGLNRCFDPARIGKPPFHQAEIAFLAAQPDGDALKAGRPSSWRKVLLEEGLKGDAAKQGAANSCADEIQQMRAHGQGEDICVLVKSHAQAAMIEDVLEQRGIPCTRAGRDSIWQTRWAEEIEIVLRALAHPGRIRALRQASLVEAFLVSAPAHDAVADAAQAATLRIEHLRWRLLHARHVWSTSGAQAALAEALLGPALSLKSYTAFQQLIEGISKDEAARESPVQALQWLERKRSRNDSGASDAPWKVIDKSAVQVMTIHHSKGLEFGTVILPFEWLAAKGRGVDRSSAIHHRKVDGEWRGVIDTLVSEQSKQKQDEEKLAESLRLFYVAVTRAEFHLVLLTPPSPGKNSALGYYALQSLEDLAHGEVTLPDDVVTQARAAVDKPWSLTAPARDFPPSWIWQSYTGLTRGSNRQGVVSGDDRDNRQSPEAADHEQAIEPIEGLDDPRTQEKLPIRFRFAKGAKAGVVLHSVLELHPFQSQMPEAPLRARLEGGGMPEILSELDALNEWIEAILTTPIALIGGACLRDIPPVRRKAELGFTLSMNGFRWPEAVAAVARHFPVSLRSRQLVRPSLFEEQGDQAPLLDGFLNGFIDLIFEWEGKFYILDWKSNFLGSRVADYKTASLEISIAEHDYALQWCLYQVALMRWLRLRMPGRDATGLIGGVVYAFVRGMTGPASPEASAGGASVVPGVYCAKTPLSLLLELDSLLGAA